MNISKIVDDYLLQFPDEKTDLEALLSLKEKYVNDQDLIWRKNFDGHITASAILIARKSQKMLKILNIPLNRYLQPGGHIESVSESPLDAAKRILGRVGLPEMPEFIPININEDIPLDIDTHPIPAIPADNEPEHVHHDFRYLFVLDDEFEVQGKDHKWEDIPTLKREGTFKDLIDKVQILWSKEYEEKQFYISVVDDVDLPLKPNFIVVQHFLPGVEHFLKSLESLGSVAAVIPKPKSKDLDVAKKLRSLYPIVELESREELATNETILEILGQRVGSVILIDIGGWFAQHIEEWSETYPGKIIGIVEDTENGHQKYLELEQLPYPIVSVARSPLKLNEDTLIGQSIVFSADSVLRSQNKLIKYMKCGVIGYGKIGKSIAMNLIVNSIKPVVFDNDPLKLIAAYNDGCLISSKKALMSSNDVIFCATGRYSICTADVPELKRGSYLFSVTSADDEFNFSGIDDNYQFEVISPEINRYYKFESSFFLVNNGNAVNFLHKAVVGDFIHLVKAEMLAALPLLFEAKPSKSILELPKSSRETISYKWLASFQDYRDVN